MSTTIRYALRDDQIVGLSDVQRGQKGLTCITCGDRLIVKDGQGALSKARLPRNAPKAKHFSHTSNSQCHGEGPAHYRLKMAIAESVRLARLMPPNQRNFRGKISYRCSDEQYGIHCMLKDAPPSNLTARGFRELELGYHDFDLLEGLNEVRTEARLDNGKTRADIAGFNEQGQPIWIIEIIRSTLSNAAIDNAKQTGLPLFIIDISTLPKGNERPSLEELNDHLYVTMACNVANGFYPSAETSYNVPCERKAFGMGPKDSKWYKEEAFFHVTTEDCADQADCPGCEPVLLHECNAGGPDERVCPDTWYMFQNGITPVHMYTQPEHLANSHIPEFSNRFNPNAKDRPPGWLTTVTV